MAGFEFVGDGNYIRLDAMMPVSLPAAPQLRVGLQLGLTHSRATVPDLTLEAYAFGVYAMASYDWKLPLYVRGGDFVITADGGLGAGIARVKIDEPFMPGRYENLVGYGIRLGSQVQYRAISGLIVAVQYIGFLVPLNTPKSANPDVEVSSDITYAFALLAGYQL